MIVRKRQVLALKNEPMVFCTGFTYLVADIRKVLDNIKIGEIDMLDFDEEIQKVPAKSGS